MSINLFLWFKEDYFYFQFVLVALGFLVKEFVRWNRDGQSRHIFNPSAIAMTIVLVGLMATGYVGVSRGVDPVASFYLPPNFFEVMFLLGLFLQFFFPTTLITLGAFLSLTLLSLAFKFILGAPLVISSIDIVVFLGLNLLVTDPASSPNTDSGKFLFGLAYGAGIFAAYVGLRYIHQPSYFDKILVVPVANLLVSAFDRMGRRVFGWGNRNKWTRPSMYSRYIHMGLYVCLFVTILPSLKNPPRDFKDPLREHVIKASQDLLQKKQDRDRWRIKYPELAAPFPFRSEITHYQETGQPGPTTTYEHYNRGVRLIAEGRPEDAMSEFQRALEIDLSLGEAHRGLGTSLRLLGKLDDAIGQYQEALKLDADDLAAHYEVAIVMRSQGKVGDAMDHYRRVLEIDPDHVGAHIDVGGVLSSQGKFADAATHYRQVIKIDPEHVSAYYNLGTVLASQGMHEEAIGHYRKTLTINPDDFLRHHNLANALAKQGRSDQAIKHYELALEAKPQFTKSRYMLATLLQQRGETTQAVAQFNKLAWILATSVDAEVRDGQTAVRIATHVCEQTNYEVPRALDTLGAAYAEVGRFDDAIASAQKALAGAEAAGQEELAGQIKARIDLYQSSQPFRQALDTP